MTEESAKTLMTALAQFIDSEIEVASNHWMERLLKLARSQKERKPVEVDESTKRLNDNWMKQHFDDDQERTSAEWTELQSEFKSINEAFEDGKKEVLAHPEKYGLCECKPAEWGEEDSDNLERVDNYLWMLDDYVGDDCAMPQGKTDKIRGYIQGILSPWLKSLPGRFSLQPKQEWSEEDEVYLQDALWCVKQAAKVARDENDMGACWSAERFLKSLRPQPKQVWSKEGKRKLNRIYEILGQAADEKPFGSSKRIIGDKEAVELQDFIKSLRPSWKPSEQEKGALRTAISVLTEERSFPKAAANLQTILDAFDGKETRKEWKPSEEQMEAVQYVSQFDYGGHKATLVSLYEQLKKL